MVYFHQIIIDELVSLFDIIVILQGIEWATHPWLTTFGYGELL